MSIDYGLTITLDATFDESTILAILQKGQQIGCRYFDFIEGVLYENAPLINAKETTAKVIVGQVLYILTHTAYVQYKDTYFRLIFDKTENNKFSINLCGINYKWKKKIFSYDHIDLAKYAEILLNLSESFIVIKFTSYDY